MKLVLIAGTNSWDGDTAIDWYCPEHPFARMLKAGNLEPLYDSNRPFIWSTDVDGLPGDRKNHIDWQSGAAALSYFMRMNDLTEMDVIAHSHGLQVALFAAATYGVKIRKLVSMGSPVRKDMEAVAKAARFSIKEWLHVHSDKSDKWQWLGEMFDGKLGIVREHPLADKNDFVPKVGHSELLRDETKYHFWKDKGWLDFLKG